MEPIPYERYKNKYVRVHLITQANVVGKLKNLDIDQFVIFLEEVLSQEQTKKSIEIVTTEEIISLKSVVGISQISSQYYEALKKPISYAKHLDNYVCVIADGGSSYGKLNRLTNEAVELQPSICFKIENGKDKPYLEENRPIIIAARSVKSVLPKTEETLMDIIKEGARGKKNKKRKHKHKK